ncbi:MAG TPA: lanthionine synthetase LanC family protein [Kofleriaceae bacterium]
MTRRALREYVSAYVDEVGSLRYADISSIQPPPYASLARGAGGIVYLLWRRGERRAARRWLAAARADRRRHAYQYTLDFPRSAFMYGTAGLHWLGALLETEGAVPAYVRAASRLRDHSYMAGSAGYLTGARILLERGSHPGLHRRTTTLASTLLAQVRDARPWNRLESSGFAVRLPGLLHALLAWHDFVGEDLPPWLVTAMHELVQAWTLDAVPTGFTATWCNGATGMVLLWVKAFASTNDEQFLDAARRMAALALSEDEPRSILCCGLAGVAYSLLELARHDPTNNNWREQAFDIGVRAVAITRRTPLEWPNGLYLGHPGVVCLAADLLADEPQGFPAIEERVLRVGT